VKKVRASSKEKARSKKRGVEPTDPPRENEPVVVAVKSTPSNKELLKELPVGILPKTESPSLDKEREDDSVKVLHELEKQIRRQHPLKLTPNMPTYPRRRTYGIPSPPNGPPTRGGVNDADSPYGNYPRGMWGGMILFSVFMTFLVSWSPGITLVWVAILTTFLLSLTECRTQASNFSRQTLLQLVILVYRKLASEYPPDIQGGGNRDMRVHPLNV
jgi:hypothetical protein